MLEKTRGNCIVTGSGAAGGVIGYDGDGAGGGGREDGGTGGGGTDVGVDKTATGDDRVDADAGEADRDVSTDLELLGSGSGENLLSQASALRARPDDVVQTGGRYPFQTTLSVEPGLPYAKVKMRARILIGTVSGVGSAWNICSN